MVVSLNLHKNKRRNYRSEEAGEKWFSLHLSITFQARTICNQNQMWKAKKKDFFNIFIFPNGKFFYFSVWINEIRVGGKKKKFDWWARKESIRIRNSICSMSLVGATIKKRRDVKMRGYEMSSAIKWFLPLNLENNLSLPLFRGEQR